MPSQSGLGLFVLALGAMPVATRMVAVLHLVALRTGVDLAAQGLGPAVLDRTHGAPMTGEQPVAILLAIRRAILAEDVRQL